MALVRIKRQDDPGDLPYWEEFEVELRPGMSVLAILDLIGERPITAEGNPTSPIAFEASCLEGLCGACTMLINGEIRLACETVACELASPITLEPLTKFPLARDLKVDRSAIFDALSRSFAWTGDGGLNEGGPERSSDPGIDDLSACVMCGACSEACPQVGARSPFAGAFIFGVLLALNSNRHGRRGMEERLDSLLRSGGIGDCAGARACEAACPKGIALSKAIARLNWEMNIHSLRRLFWG